MAKTDVRNEQLASLFLARLERLCNLEARFVAPPDGLIEPQRLVCKATFATYCDCVALGYKGEAERLVGTTRAPGDSSSTAITPRGSDC